MRKITLAVCCAWAVNASAQFHPPAGQPGSSAIHKDSTIITAWANGCVTVRGYQNVANTSAGYASAGNDSSAIGVADGASIVSLGDGGYATLTFSPSIYNGPGYDFCVFENSFSDTFLELAFVEVSSDGVNFFRFAATSNTQDTVQTNSFGPTDATLVNNLAGKYRALFGTPFDLQELSGTAGLDIDNITHVRVLDVVGNILNPYATYDQFAHAVNDPWPTEFASGGFDLDAVGVIHQNPENIPVNTSPVFTLYPQPCQSELTVTGNDLSDYQFYLCSQEGKNIGIQKHVEKTRATFNLNQCSGGMYILRAVSTQHVYSFKILVE